MGAHKSGNACSSPYRPGRRRPVKKKISDRRVVYTRFFNLRRCVIAKVSGRRNEKEDAVRINGAIRAREVRVVGPEGEQIGVMGSREALSLAEEKGLDLVEVAPNARPPVVRIMDYGKFRYEQTKKQKKNKKNVIQVKEIQFRPKTDIHDYNFKVRHIREFLEKGHRVKVGVYFRGREMAYLDKGREILAQVMQELEEVAKIEKDIDQAGHLMFLIVSPKK